MAAKTVFLIGFMGSGKTTFGKKLAHKLQLRIVDLDEAIIQKYQVPSIKILVEQRGIEFFRGAESETLKWLDIENAVVATGGGTPCYFDNMDWMKRRGAVVFLKVDEGVLFSRLKTIDLEERPLLKDLDEEGLKRFIHDKLSERLPFYNQAHISFDPIHEKIEGLIQLLNKH